MLTESFFSYQKYRWLFVNLFVLFVLILIYLFHSPVSDPNGGTVYGYSLGVLATSAILYLMWYGIRRRSYYSRHTTLKGWLSAHVWIGISLLVIVPLHSGFRIGMNVHGLSYMIMAAVILSGIWGAVNYKILAPQIGSNRGSGSLKALIEQLHIYSQNISELCKQKSDQLLELRNQIEVSLPKSVFFIIFRALPKEISDKQIAESISKISTDEKEIGLNLIQLCEKKRSLAVLIQKDIRIASKLKLWLLLHLPLSFALLVVVFIHIFTVLKYR